jgi:hypothetical protein
LCKQPEAVAAWHGRSEVFDVGSDVCVDKGGERFIHEGRDRGRQDWVVLHYERGAEVCARTSLTAFLNVRKVSRRVRGLVSGRSTFRWKRAAVFVRSLVSRVTFLKCARLRLLLLVGFFLWLFVAGFRFLRVAFRFPRVGTR